MSKMNAVRMINLNYNNNSMKISDETFHMQGKTILLSLRNGGGKSVMVQMMTAPFVHKKYRNTKDRPFDSYFTTMKPSFIMVEWALDGGSGYCLTGMMVRKNQSMEDLNDEKLEIINFIAEYKERCEYDIFHFPVVEKNGKEVVLKPYRECRQLFEIYKKEKSIDFQYYDMNNPAASRQYFQRLSEYQIYYKEWENIIRKVNLEESGLSKLFADCRDEKDLVEKWFLDAVENKLNGEGNRIKGFQEMVGKYVGQYRDNQSHIKKRENILVFKEDSIQLEELAKRYLEKEETVAKDYRRIGDFLEELHGIETYLEWKKSQNEREIQALCEEIEKLEYAMDSGTVYKLKDECKVHVQNREMISLENENLKEQLAKKQERLHLLICAKQKEKKHEYEAEVKYLQEKKKAASLEAEAIAPEREEIGGKLKGYYQWLLQEQREKVQQFEQEKLVTEDLLKVKEQELLENQQNSDKALQELTRYKTHMEQYDKVEDQYNAKHKENFARNIMGEYEAGFLEICGKKYQKELEETRAHLLELQKQLEEQKQQELLLGKKLEETKEEQRQLLNRKEKLQEQREEAQRQIDQRYLVMRYLEIPQDKLWDTGIILDGAERKCKDIQGYLRELERSLEKQNQELKSLVTGKTLELPGEIEEHFRSLELQPLQGMEWLKKNGKTEEENRELVRSNPFLPYGLILTGKQIEVLKKSEHAGIFSSFPIPILEREKLEEISSSTENGILSFEQVHFYMMFNEFLLNEEELNRLIEKKKEEIAKLEERIEIRNQEYKEAFQRAELIHNQSITKESYEKLLVDIKEAEESLQQVVRLLEDYQTGLRKLDSEMEEVSSGIQQKKEGLFHQEERQKQFEELCQEYETYQKNRELLQLKQKERNRLEEQRKLIESSLEKGREKLEELRQQLNLCQQQLEKWQEESRIYEEYQELSYEEDEACSKDLNEDIASEKERVFYDQDDIENLKARFRAITSELSQNLQELEQQLQKESAHLQRENKELDKLLKKYGLSLEAVDKCTYMEEEEQTLEKASVKLEAQISIKDNAFHDEDKKIGILESKINEQENAIFQKFHVDRLLPREEISQVDYESQMNQLKYQRMQIEETQNSNQKHLGYVQENITALAEYEIEESLSEGSLEGRRRAVEWSSLEAETLGGAEQALIQSVYFVMDRNKLRESQGILVRDLKAASKETTHAKSAVEQYLMNLSQKKEFQEEDFVKCLSVLRSATETAAMFWEQFETVLHSYEALLQKLEVDLALIERERQEVEGLLFDYARDVHKNLGFIDNNSTITVRNHPVKMLRIVLPDWEEQEKMYEVRLQDLLRDITEKSMGIYDKNESPTDYIGSHITTTGIYDSIVGLGNIQIKLYKIEAEREYPITWREALKNSGGEGFLSAFVILSCLLYYMRKDDMDFFADRNEGKVLVMDNPFAQTNAAHLLKPLMDMAKKTNTQLICLSGLGGDSIYSCFDNIYVLKLVNASIRGGLQYMKGDHIRGQEEEVMITSRIEVMEQQELLF